MRAVQRGGGATVKSVRALAFVAALCAVLIVGCGGDRGGDAAAQAVRPTETAVSPEASNRPSAPAIEGVSLDGERLALADFRGRPVFVNVWSSW